MKKLPPGTVRSINIGMGKSLLDAWIKSSPTPAKSDAALTTPTGIIPEPETDEEKWNRMNRVQKAIMDREMAEWEGQGNKPEITEVAGKERAGENVASPAGPKNNEETARPTDEQANASTEKIISMVYPLSGDFGRDLNHYLRTNANEHHISFIYDPNQLKAYMLSVAKGFDIEGGDIEVGKDNRIAISHLRITKLGVGVTLDLVLNNGKDGIAAQITKFHRDFLARTNKASSREEGERQIKAINSTIKKRLNEMKDPDNRLWSAKKISISEGKVRVEFEKTTPEPEPEGELDVPSFLRRNSTKNRGFFR